MRIRFFLIIILLQCTLSAQSSDEKDGYTITINQDSFGTYPAVILDVDTGQLIKLEKKETEEESFKGITVKNGFFIEPNDPEFSSISFVNPDLQPRLTILDQDTITLDEAKKIEIKNTEVDDLKNGLIFLVKTSDDNFFRFQIISFEKAKSEIKLKFDKIK